MLVAVYRDQCNTQYEQKCSTQYKEEVEYYTETECNTDYKEDCEYQWEGSGNNKVSHPRLLLVDTWLSLAEILMLLLQISSAIKNQRREFKMNLDIGGILCLSLVMA